jgi:hypothetical protein
MPTSSQEYRRLADECLEVVNEPKEWYVRVALLQLAAEFKKRAEHLEQRPGCLIFPSARIGNCVRRCPPLPRAKPWGKELRPFRD